MRAKVSVAGRDTVSLGILLSCQNLRNHIAIICNVMPVVNNALNDEPGGIVGRGTGLRTL